MKKRWPGFVLFVLILIAWEYASASNLVDPVSVPRVSTIVSSWVVSIENGQLLAALAPSLGRMAAALSSPPSLQCRSVS